jgi:hypothetical protein
MFLSLFSILLGWVGFFIASSLLVLWTIHQLVSYPEKLKRLHQAFDPKTQSFQKLKQTLLKQTFIDKRFHNPQTHQSNLQILLCNPAQEAHRLRFAKKLLGNTLVLIPQEFLLSHSQEQLTYAIYSQLPRFSKYLFVQESSLVRARKVTLDLSWLKPTCFIFWLQYLKESIDSSRQFNPQRPLTVSWLVWYAYWFGFLGPAKPDSR